MPEVRYDDEAVGRLLPVEEADEDYSAELDEWEGVSPTIAALTEQREEVRDRIEDRRRYGATDESLASDSELLELLDRQLQVAHEDRPEAKVAERRDETAARPRRPDPWREALQAALSAEDLALYDARRAGVSQTKLARDLGISQGAVSKREARIVAEVKELHLKVTGRSLASLDGKRRPGVRGKGRNIPGSP